MARFDLTDEEWSVIAQLSKTRPTAINGTLQKSDALEKLPLRHQHQTFSGPPAFGRFVRIAAVYNCRIYGSEPDTTSTPKDQRAFALRALRLLDPGYLLRKFRDDGWGRVPFRFPRPFMLASL